SPHDSSVCWATASEGDDSTGWVPARALEQVQPQRSADHLGSSLQRRKSDVTIFRIKQAADLAAAGFHFFSKALPGNVLGFTGLEHLPCKDLLDRRCLKFLKLAVFLQESVERAQSGCLAGRLPLPALGHSDLLQPSNSIFRLRA